MLPHVATIEGHLEVLRLLLEAGVEQEAATEEGGVPSWKLCVISARSCKLAKMQQLKMVKRL